MKFIIDNTGQTCNKFWAYIAPLQYVLDKREHIYVLFPDKKIKDYPNLLKNKYLRIPFPYLLLSKLIEFQRIERITRKILTNRFINIVDLLTKRNPNMFWHSWQDRWIEPNKSTKKYIRKIFSPQQKIIKNVNEKFKRERIDFDYLIGIHIRRGDYEEWLDGKYFYSLNNYLDICISIEKDFYPKKCKFFIASNESIPPEIFKIVNWFVLDDPTASADLYGLSCCDFIIGPPSSFSRWASFIGETPIKFILSPTKLTKSFRVISSYSKYSTGEDVEFSV